MPAPTASRPEPAPTCQHRPARPLAGDPEAPLALRSPYGRWRALTLVLLLLGMTAHVLHWKLSGRTVAPLELHEVMFTLEKGVVTAGFLFMAAACVATAVFGRFFCSWGCHMIALQDFCAWLLRKVGLRPRPVRSRLLAFVPLGVLTYMFFLPQLTRMWAGQAFPPLRFTDDTEVVASFVTTNFWRNLPGPWIAGLTLLICGGVAVWVLGSRGFCTYGCPYGALFRGAARLAPGGIRVDDRCVQCGTCTKVCTSGVRVHEEIRNFGMVTDARCVRDLDCVGACPEGALHFGFGRPPLLRGAAHGKPVARVFDFRLGEEVLMALVFAGSLLAWRGLYNEVPFLMSVGLGGIAAYLTVVAVRLWQRREVYLANHALKVQGRWRPAGVALAAGVGLFWLGTVHAAALQVLVRHGRAAFRTAQAAVAGQPTGDVAAKLGAAATALLTVERWSMVPTVETKVELAWLAFQDRDPARAEARVREALAIDPDHVESHYLLGDLLERRGQGGAALDEFSACVRLQPQRATAHLRLARLLAAAGRGGEAEPHFARARELDPRLTR